MEHGFTAYKLRCRCAFTSKMEDKMEVYCLTIVFQNTSMSGNATLVTDAARISTIVESVNIRMKNINP
jgi:hypothetical protein